MQEFKNLKEINPKSTSEITELNDYVRLKINSLYIQ